MSLSHTSHLLIIGAVFEKGNLTLAVPKRIMSDFAMEYLTWSSKDIISWKNYIHTEVIHTRRNQTTMIVCVCLELIVFTTFSQLDYGVYQFSEAQLVPLPPPAPDIKPEQTQNQNTSQDNVPPVIQFVTTELADGKNVLKVNVTDSSEIRLREVSFVDDGKIRTETLVYEGNNIYKALVDVNPPSAVIVINVDDVYGNEASLAKSVPVKESQSIISRILDMLIKR